MNSFKNKAKTGKLVSAWTVEGNVKAGRRFNPEELPLPCSATVGQPDLVGSHPAVTNGSKSFTHIRFFFGIVCLGITHICYDLSAGIERVIIKGWFYGNWGWVKMTHWQFLGKCSLHLNVTHPIIHRKKLFMKKDKSYRLWHADDFNSCFQNKPMWVEPK